MKFTHKVVAISSDFISSKVAWRISQFFLALQGIGWGGEIESSGELKFINRHLKKIKRPLIFDVGAHLGEYGSACIDANSEATVHCFEPSKSHYDEMVEKLSNPHSNFIFNQFGLSDSSGTFTLYKDAQITGLASVNKRNLKHLGIDLSIEERCQFVNSAEYCKEHNIEFIDLLKIDVEGAEFIVLKSFQHFFENKKISVCQFEFGHANIDSALYFRDYFDFFESCNYKLSILRPNGVLEPINAYEERYENLYIANFVATVDQ